MVLDGLTLNICADELKKKLPGAKVTKINMPAKEEVSLQLYSKAEGSFRLNISAAGDSCAVFLGEMKRQNPKTPPSFCMLLRKHLSGAYVEDILRHGCDRVIRVVFSAKDELLTKTRLTLVCEIMGKYSNIILLNKNNRVIDSAKRVSVDVSSLRQVLPGSTYELPPMEQYDITALSDVTLYEIINAAKGENASRFLSRTFQGISRQTAAEILTRCNMEDADISSFDKTRRRIIASAAKSFFEEAFASPFPCVQLNEEGLPVFVSVLPYISYPEDLRKSFDTCNEALFFCYHGRMEHFVLRQRKDNVKKHLSKLVSKLTKKIKTLTEGILDAEKADSLTHRANIITANMYLLKKGQESFSGIDYETGETVKITLDKTLSPSQNAQKLYKKAAKLKTSAEIYEKRLKDAEAEKEFIENSIMFADKAESTDELSEIESVLIKEKVLETPKGKKQTAEISEPKAFTSPSGYTVLVGKNDRQNDRLTMGLAKKEDIWFHAQKMPGSHVLLVTNGKDINDIDDDTVVFAAKLAAKYSAAKLGGKTPVDYTYRANVKKPPASRPGKVIYEHYWTVYVD